MPQEELKALKRACAYSTFPNMLGYCGPEGSWRQLQKFASEPSEENAASARTLLTRFNALYPYLRLIAEENEKEAFDAEVIEAYWIGNGLLEGIRFRALQKTILSLQNHGLPRPIAEKRAASLPEGMMAHHSMHVLYVNSISAKVKPLVQNMGNCLIQWATVKEETANGTKVKGVELIQESGELKLREKEKTLQNPLGIELNAGDTVSVHWSNLVEKITPKQKKSLQRYTEKTLSLLRP